MAILSLDDAKACLRVDHDEEDLLIQGYMDAAQAWIERVTGRTFESAPADIQQAARMLIAHWYDTRAGVSEKAMAAVPMGIRSLVANHRSFAHGPRDIVTPQVPE